MFSIIISLTSAPTHEPTSSNSKLKGVWFDNVAGSSSTAVEQISPSEGRRRGAAQAQETIEAYRQGSLDEERSSEELQEANTIVASLWNYLKPKVIAPRLMDDPNIVDPYAHVRGVDPDPYVGHNVFVFQDENGFKSIDKTEQALLRFNEPDLFSQNKGFTPFVEPETDSEFGDTPPSLTDDYSTIVDDNSVSGFNPEDPEISEVIDNWS